MAKRAKGAARFTDPRMRRLANAFASSLLYFMGDRAPNEIAVKLGMSPNTIRNWLRLSTPKGSNTGNFPQIDTLDAVAKELKCEVWQLLHPDIKHLMADLALVEKTKAIYAQSHPHRELPTTNSNE